MNTLPILISFTVAFLFQNLVLADNKCQSGQSQNSSLLDNLKTAQKNSTITQMLYSKYNLSKARTEAQPPCLTCESVSAKNALREIEMSLAKVPKAPQMIFRSECINASHIFSAAAPEVVCKDDRASSIKHSKGSPTQCIDSHFLNYQNAVISNFLGCIRREGFSNVDSATLFKMYSLESGFKPQYFSKNGSGLGQLTRIFVDDLFGNGRKFVNQIAQSTSPECDVAKILAKKDLEKRPPISDSCAYMSPGEGLERNIFYSLIGFAHTWNSYLDKKFQPYQSKFFDDASLTEVRSLILMTSYGPSGQAGAKALIRRFTKGGIKPSEAVNILKNPIKTENNSNMTTVYTSRWRKREEALKKVLSSPLKENYIKLGAAACVTPI